MMMSVMTRSVGLRASSANASMALSTVRTEYPARSSTYFTESRTSGSSSTTKMFCIFAPPRRRQIADHFEASDSREKYSKRGTRANFRFHRDASTETLYDAMDHRKAHTCALANGPRGKERLKYTLNGSRVHSPSRVANP